MKLYQKGSTPYERYSSLSLLLNEVIEGNLKKTDESVKDMRKAIYFSMEFLMGRLITNNLYNLGFYSIVKRAFIDLGLNINKVELAETDTGLGNGGLGRLAAGFLDSSVSLRIPVYGNSIRYNTAFLL